MPHRKSHELTLVWIPDISANKKPHPKEWPFWGEVYITKLGWQPSLQTVLPCNYSNIGPFLRQRIIVPLSGQRQEQMFLNLLYCYWHSLLYGRLPSEYFTSLGIVYERRAADMTGYEILSLVIEILTLVIASIALLLKLFAILDNRYKSK